MMTVTLPLDPEFNEAVLSIARRLFPEGFDVSANAPDTYKKLATHLDAGKRHIVYSGGSDTTIYGDPAVNYAFRAWHDWSHWKGRHDFSFGGEVGACKLQQAYLIMTFGDTEKTRLWCQLVRAEVVGQAMYYLCHNRFLNNQRGFVAAFLEDQDAAVVCSSW